MAGDAYSCKRQLNNCSCVTNVGDWIIDLSPLDNEAHNRPLFSVDGPDVIYECVFSLCNLIESF